MDDRVLISLLCIAMLAVWWLLDVMVATLEHAHGPSHSVFGGIAFMLLMSASSFAAIGIAVFVCLTTAIALGAAWQALYYLRIRRP